MRYILRSILLSVMVVLACITPTTPASAHADAPDLTGRVTANNPEKASLRLQNTTNHACQIATSSQGTVAITSLEQDGKMIQPTAQDGAFSEDIGYLLKAQLKTLQPGESADIPLEVYALKSGLVVRSTTWSRDAGVFSQDYRVQTGKPLKMALNYSLPIATESDTPICSTVFVGNVTDGGLSRGLKIALLVGAIGVAFALVVVVMRLVRRRRRPHADAKKTAGIGVVLLAVGTSVVFGGLTSPVKADIVVPPGMQSQFDSCMGVFEANRDITGPALDLMNDPANHVEIVYTTRGSDMTARRNDRGGMDITIYWNPNDRHAYAGTGGNADMCTPLFHEMSHGVDMHNGTFSRDDCAGSGIETKEVVATRAQNALRVRLGMPPRSHYGETPLPSGSCTEPPSSARCTGSRCGDTNGDPHLRTFDGLRYDFQAVGEFVAARNKSGTYEIQVRQEPWESSRVVSLNTAVALKAGSDKVEVRAGPHMTLVINGKVQELKVHRLADGARVDMEGGVIVITWGDQSKAFVRSVGSYGLALSVEPSQALAGDLEGLLGDANGNSDNDLRVRGSNKGVKSEHKQLYPEFADSWRIGAKDSLFSYTSGKTTKSYTDTSFPDELPDPKSLPGYAAAEAFCKSLGITDATILANCALDMAITGRPEFARAAAHSQAFSAGADFGGTTWELAIKKPGEEPSVTFDAKANEKIFVDIPRSSLPSQCGVLRLLQPDGQELVSGCIINGSGEIDGIVLPAAGTYTLRLATNNDTTGFATLRLLRITDQQLPIVPDGKPVKAKINKPGVVSRLSFSGQAGQRVYIEASSNTVKSQCGMLRLLKPDGGELKSGCIINGVGEIDTAVLPETGQYTVVVDPNGTVTGEVTLRLVLPTAESKPITLNGSEQTVSLKKPGSIAQFTFDGTAGQRIFIDIPRSDLPSQCGILDVQDPTGYVAASGCIINGKGGLSEDGHVLTKSGRYTIVLDPSDAVTGTASVRLRSR